MSFLGGFLAALIFTARLSDGFRQAPTVRNTLLFQSQYLHLRESLPADTGNFCVCFRFSLHSDFRFSLLFAQIFSTCNWRVVVVVAVRIHDSLIYISCTIFHCASEYSEFLLFTGLITLKNCCLLLFAPLDQVTQVIDRFDTCGGGACCDRFFLFCVCRAALRFAVTPSATLSGCKLKSTRRAPTTGVPMVNITDTHGHASEREYP